MSDLAYRSILKALFERRVPAGAFVSQNDLVELLDIPIQPLRDALRVLQSEGVLTIHARTGIQFLNPDLELARSTYQFRSIIERAAAQRFAETGDASTIDAMLAAHRELLEKVEREASAVGGMSKDSRNSLEKLDEELHARLIQSLRNPLVETTARRLKNYVTLIRLDRLTTAPLALRTLKEHIDILEACKDRDAQRAEAALSAHFQAALHRILGMC
jgi:DNA-binding GntR family transcriptional regulator